MFLPHPRVKVSIVGSLRDREVACSASDRQGSNFESCVWRTVSSLAQFSLYVHRGGLKPDLFHFISNVIHLVRLGPCSRPIRSLRYIVAGTRIRALYGVCYTVIFYGHIDQGCLRVEIGCYVFFACWKALMAHSIRLWFETQRYWFRIAVGSDVCHRGCVYAVLDTVQKPGVCSVVHGSVDYKEPLKSFDLRVGHSPDFGLLSVAILPWLYSDVKQYSPTSQLTSSK